MERDKSFFAVQVIIIVSRALAVSSITFFTDIYIYNIYIYVFLFFVDAFVFCSN